MRHRSTEAGLRLLGGTLRNYRGSIKKEVFLPGRIHETELGSTHPRELLAQSTFLRLVSVAEATVDSLGTELTNQTIAAADRTVRMLALEKELATSSSWRMRRRSFRRHHGIDLQKCRDYKRLEGAMEVRNAIAHGLGRLTTRQVTSKETLGYLRRIEVDVVNGFVRLQSSHVEACASYCGSFLKAIDDALS